MEETSASSRAEMLKARKKRCVCKFCGGPLSLKRIVFSNFEDSRIELYCDRCDRVEFGTEPAVYRSAEDFVDQLNYNFYPDMDDNAARRQMNIAKICEIMAWGYRHLGLIDQEGFTVTLPETAHHWEECLTFRDREMTEEAADGGSDH